MIKWYKDNKRTKNRWAKFSGYNICVKSLVHAMPGEIKGLAEGI